MPVNGGNTFQIYGQSGGTGSLTLSGVGEYNAGIGSNNGNSGGTVIINGGVVTATDGIVAAGIGLGSYAFTVAVTINGGTVTAKDGVNGVAGIGFGFGGSGYMTVLINGGSVNASSISNSNGMPQNSAGTKLFPAKITGLSSFDASTLAISNTDGTSYPYNTKDMKLIDGTLYLYVPSTVSSIKLGNVNYVCNRSGEWYIVHSPNGADYCSSGNKALFSITISETTNGTFGTDKASAAAGDPVNIIPDPDAGYEVDKVTVTDESGRKISVRDNGDGTYTFTQPESNVYISVTFKNSGMDAWYQTLRTLFRQEFRITTPASKGGTITTAGDSTVLYDGNITYTITPEEGYRISDVLVNGESVGPVSEYTFKRVQDNHSIQAIFTKISWENPFTDVSENDWFCKDIQFVSENGLMIGTNDAGTEFSPDTIVNRGMIVTILWRMEGEPSAHDPAYFTDVPDDAWYAEAVAWASAHGIVLGYGDDTFGPLDSLTREQIAAIFQRYAAYKGWDDGITFPMLPQYTYSAWAEENVLWAERTGLYDALGIDVSDLTNAASRAETAAYLRRFSMAYNQEN